MNEDQAVLAQYRAGDVAALETLIERYRRPLFGFILRMIDEREEAEDIFQEVWIRAIRNLARFDGRRLLSWLFRIAQNVIIDRARTRKPESSLQEAIGDGITRQDGVAAQGISPLEAVAAEDIQQRINQAVQRLPFEQRTVFLMRMQAGLSFKEIARIEKVSINTALARMRYALEKLRAELKDDYQALARS